MSLYVVICGLIAEAFICIVIRIAKFSFTKIGIIGNPLFIILMLLDLSTFALVYPTYKMRVAGVV